MIIKKKKILIYQPTLTHYRASLFNNMTKYFDLTLCCNKSNQKEGFLKINDKIKFQTIVSSKINFFYLFFQTNLITNIINNKYDKVVLTCDVKNITNYIILFLCKLIGVRCYIWGHGLFGKPNNFSKKIIYHLYYFFLNLFIYKYIAYNRYSKITLLKVFNKNKILILTNRLEKHLPIIKKNHNLKNILFIGRLRNRCMLDILLKAMVIVNQKYKDLKLEIIGNGELFYKYNKLAKKLRINCKFYKEKKDFISISKNCFVGVYPGDAGLSVVEYMMLGLPVIKHNKMNEHAGPEPFYIKNNYNGLTFKKGSSIDLSKKIIQIFSDKKLRSKLKKNSLKKIKKINKIPMSKEFFKILNLS